MGLLPSETLEIATASSPGDLQARLEAGVAPGPVTALVTPPDPPGPSRPFRGEVRGDGFAICRNLRYSTTGKSPFGVRNKTGPVVARGAIHSAGSGSRVAIRLSLSPFVVVIFWVSLLFVAVVSGVLVFLSVQDSGLPQFLVFLPIFMVLSDWLAFRFVYWIDARRARPALRALLAPEVPSALPRGGRPTARG